MASLSCCAQLGAIGNLHVAFQNTTSYTTIEKSYWSLQEATLTPSCIVQPRTSSDIARLIAYIAGKPDCNLAIKSQGHAPAAGFANIVDGITIDLTTLNTVSLSHDHQVASVGSGANWLDVYSFLDSFNKTVAGGRNGAVGVGGLTVGGGISYFSPQVGFTCDTVVNYEVALASGQLVNANAATNADLFRALKGGLNNFGVVTRIDFKTLPINQILGGHLINDISHRGDVFNALAGLAGAKEYDVHASIVTSLIWSSTTKAWILLSAPIYTQPEENPSVYRELFDVPAISNTIQITPLHVLANETAPPQANQLFATGTYGVSAELLDNIFNIANKTFVSSALPTGAQLILSFEPFPTVFVAFGSRKNSLGTSPQNGNSMILLLSASWTDPNSGAMVRSLVERTLEQINAVAKEKRLLKRFIYSNYADAWQKPLESYGVDNLEFLRGVAAKYDPWGVFQKQIPGGFKLR